MTVSLRDATTSDIDALLTLNRYVQAWHAETYPAAFKADPDPMAMRRFFNELLESQDAFVTLAEMGGQPVGYLFATHQTRPETHISLARWRVHIEHVCVAPEARRCGIASLLLENATERARALGCDEITLDTWAANDTAHATFEKNGFVTTRLWYAKPL